jgi:hypothetical protein
VVWLAHVWRAREGVYSYEQIELPSAPRHGRTQHFLITFHYQM